MRYTATFLPQTLINDDAYRVDPLGDVSWDCTGFLTGRFTEEQILDGLDGNWAITDDLKYDPNAPEWIQEWPGPYEITLSETVDG